MGNIFGAMSDPTCSTTGDAGYCCWCPSGTPFTGDCDGCEGTIGSNGTCPDGLTALCPLEGNDCAYIQGRFTNCNAGQRGPTYYRRLSVAGTYTASCGIYSPIDVDVNTSSGRRKVRDCLKATMQYLKWPKPLLGPLHIQLHPDFQLSEGTLLYGTDDSKATYPVHHGDGYYPSIPSLESFVDSHIDCMMGSPTVTCIYYNASKHSSMLTRVEPTISFYPFLIVAMSIVTVFLFICNRKRVLKKITRS